MRPFVLKTLFIKDWKELIKSKQALIPMIVVPAVFIVVLPLAILLAGSADALNTVMTGDLDVFLEQLPSHMIPADFDQTQTLVYAMVMYFMAPLFLLIPVMFASIIASSSFAGEKEQKTLEGLLYTPATDKELVLGKILVALIPAIGISVICFLIYSVLVNALGSGLFGGLFFPNWSWIIMLIFLVPGVSFLSLGLVVRISQRAAGMWEAQQISVVLLLPIIGIVISQAAGVIYLSITGILIASGICFILDYLLYRWIVGTFSREQMVTKLT